MRIEELVEEISMLRWGDGIETWKITEEFRKKNEYTLVGLEIEVEQGIVCAADSKGEIYCSPKVLMGFLAESIINIEHKDKAEFTIYFKDGTIVIKGYGDNNKNLR